MIFIAIPAFASSPLVPALIERFENTTGSQSDELGAATAIDGAYAVVGAPGIGNGRAFVYARQQTPGQEDRWVVEATLESGESGITTFGSAVAISGNTIAVGTRHTRGGLYVFERDETTGAWSRTQVFKHDKAFDSVAGSSIAIDGDLMVAGIENISFVDAPGEAWVYRRSSLGWTREAVLKGSEYATSDESGTAVDVQGDTIVFGAPDLRDPITNEMGSIFVFRYDGNQWSKVQRIRARSVAERRIGRSLRLDHDRLATISSGQDPDSKYFGQAVQVFERQPETRGEWKLAGSIWPSTIGGVTEIFGMLAFEDGLLVVNGREQTFDTQIYALERKSDPAGGDSWLPAHSGSLASPPPVGLGVTGGVGDFSEGVLLMGLPRWTSSGLPFDVGAHYFARLLPHPDAPEFVGVPTNAVEVVEGQMFSMEIRANDPAGGNVSVTAEKVPEWLSFTPDGTGGGTLSGTPGPGDAGSTELIFAAQSSYGGLRNRRTLRVDVVPLTVPPIVTAFTSSRVEVPAGDPVTLHWHVLGADSILLKPVGEVLKDRTGTIEVRTRRSTTYVIEAMNSNGVTRAEIRVNVPIFGAPKLIAPLHGTDAAVAADYDGDGDFDLLAVLRSPNSLGWFENTGAAFAPPESFPAEFRSPISNSELLAADLDGDGNTDLLYSEFGNLWYVRSLGKAAGFAPAVSIYQAQFPSPFCVTDVNGDSQPDVVLVVDERKIVWLRQNNGRFTFGGDILTERSLHSIATADLDKDGRDDIVFTRWNGGLTDIHLGWMRNLGGRFSPPNYVDAPTRDTRWVKVGDLDGDGLPDLLTAGFHIDNVEWRRNLGNGKFGPPVRITTGTNSTTFLLAEDLDGDGDLDVAVTSEGDSEVSWFENLGDGNFGRQQIITTAMQRPEWIQAVDVDGDGDLDLIARGTGEVRWMENENDPPIPAEVPPLYLIEDSEAVELDLGQFFDDPQDPDEELTYTVEAITGDPAISAVLSVDGRKLVVSPVRDTFGSARLMIRATDPAGLSGRLELLVEVVELVDLGLQVMQDRPLVGAPDSVTHRVEISNSGPSDATGIRIHISQNLPSGVSLSSATPSSGTYSEGIWEIQELPEGASANLDVICAISEKTDGGVNVLRTSATLLDVTQPPAVPGELSAFTVTSIVSPKQMAVAPSTVTTTLDPQTGLMSHVISIRNDNPLGVSSVRVVVLDLPEGVRLTNAYGRTDDNLPYVDSLMDLPPGEETTLTIEFHVPNRVSFAPTYRVVAAFTADPPEPKAAESAPATDRMLRLSDGSFLIEFPSEPGREYAIEYSDDLRTWRRVVSSVTATANRTQWIDNGPPKTISHPSSTPKRYYRFVTLPE